MDPSRCDYIVELPLTVVLCWQYSHSSPPQTRVQIISLSACDVTPTQGSADDAQTATRPFPPGNGSPRVVNIMCNVRGH